MDHFCPWINSAVGNGNHVEFLAFVTLVPIGCAFATSIQIAWMWNFVPPPKHWRQLSYYHPEAFNAMIYTFFATACSVAVGLAVGALGLFQWMGVWWNMTQIEEWIVEKAETRPRDAPFVFPYDLGSGPSNVGEVFVRWYEANGTEWTVREGSHKFALTEEQLAQKALKRSRMRTVRIVKANSRWFRGCEFGFWVWWHSPWPLEPRITVAPGDFVRAWSYEEDWLYGEKVERVGDGNSFEPVKPRQRGWFPDRCVRDDDDDVVDDNDGAPDAAFGCIGSEGPSENLDSKKSKKNKKNK